MIKVFSENNSSRLKYVLDELLVHRMGLSYSVEENWSDFVASSGAKINYSNREGDAGIAISPMGLLFEEEINELRPEVIEWKNSYCIFPVQKGDWSFDVLSATFYILSRYEEYLDFKGDNHNRFTPEDSIFNSDEVLMSPMIDYWEEELKKQLKEKYPSLKISQSKFQYLPTIDVDNAFAYLSKGGIRAILSGLKDLLKGDLENFKFRLKVIFRKEKDPYDTYDYIKSVFEKYDTKGIFFFLLGDWGRIDRNVSHRRYRLQTLISRLYRSYPVGIHPSYASNSKKGKVETERLRLEKILKYRVGKSRQHFLMLKFPDTYRNLIRKWLSEDYSMGYAQKLGFRAGTSRPFYWFDLSREEATRLKIFPFVYMDATLNNYMKLSPAEAIEKVEELMNRVKEVNGLFISLWHNETLSDRGNWKGWRKVFEESSKLGTRA